MKEGHIRQTAAGPAMIGQLGVSLTSWSVKIAIMVMRFTR